jgi:uncharacterized repeat protein (TIGR03803 family)
MQAQTYTVLYNYGTNPGDPLSPTPLGIGAQGRDGLFYSTTALGGANLTGTAFKVTTSGALTKLTDFGYPTPGSSPSGGLTLGLDGNLWGTTAGGGSALSGTIFKISPSGTLTVVFNFTGGTDEGVPYSAPVLGADGNYYGVNQGVYAGTYGEAYKMTPTGTVIPIHSFTFTDGSAPWGLALGNDGNFYGLTKGGGSASSMGVAFKMTTAGKVTVLHTFAGFPSDGNLPEGMLTQANDGNFYGVTYFGGTLNLGTIVKVTPSGQTTIMYNFCSSTGCTDGKNPLTGMVLGTDGNLYGTAEGGTHGAGVIYKFTTSGTYTVLYNLCALAGCADGFFPQTPLMQHTNGMFYGSMESGGTKAGGVFYSLDLGLGPFARLVNWSGKVGKTVEILGQGFTGTTKVTFSGVSAAFTVVSDTYLTVVVPAGAPTGFVNVATPGANLKSDRKFLVTPQLLSFNPTSGSVGTPVTLTGLSFTGATKVTFGGIKATTFSVDSDTQITATVPTGAKTGKIQVTTPGGVATSATDFTVTL